MFYKRVGMEMGRSCSLKIFNYVPAIENMNNHTSVGVLIINYLDYSMTIERPNPPLP